MVSPFFQHYDIKYFFQNTLYKQTCTKYTAGPDLQLTSKSHDYLSVVILFSPSAHRKALVT